MTYTSLTNVRVSEYISAMSQTEIRYFKAYQEFKFLSKFIQYQIFFIHAIQSMLLPYLNLLFLISNIRKKTLETTENSVKSSEQPRSNIFWLCVRTL